MVLLILHHRASIIRNHQLLGWRNHHEKKVVRKGGLFADRISMPNPEAKLMKAVSKQRNLSNSAWTVIPSTGANNYYDPLNPDRVVQKQFLLVHRSAKKIQLIMHYLALQKYLERH